MTRQKILKNIAKLFPIVLLTICLTRIWTISLFYIFGKDSPTTDRIINDPWHHYQVGLMLVVVALLFGRLKRFKLLLAIGLGIFLEEWPVFLNDLGLNTNYLYHTKVDFMGIFVLVGLVYILSKFFYSKVGLKSV
jgi:hypothetical protein